MDDGRICVLSLVPLCYRTTNKVDRERYRMSHRDQIVVIFNLELKRSTHSLLNFRCCLHGKQIFGILKSRKKNNAIMMYCHDDSGYELNNFSRSNYRPSLYLVDVLIFWVPYLTNFLTPNNKKTIIAKNLGFFNTVHTHPLLGSEFES